MFKNYKTLCQKVFLTTLSFFLISDISFANNHTGIPEAVINYAKKHNLQLEVDKYEIEKSDVENGDKYKYIYPCSTKDGQIYAILYRNKFYIKTATPRALNIIYIGTR